MNRKNKSILISSILLCIFTTLFIASYGFYEFSNSTDQIVLNTGTINMYVTSSNELTLTNMFPETLSSAVSKSNNYIDFTVTSTNTYDKDLYYEILLDYGDDQESKTRILDKYLRFEITDITNSKVIERNISFSNIQNQKLYVDSIVSGSSDIAKSYRLRIWITDSIVIGDYNSDYSYTDWNNLFASVKVTVNLLSENNNIYNVMGTLPDVITNQKSNITELYFLNDTEENIFTRYSAATYKSYVTNVDKTAGTTELQNMSDYGKVYAWLEQISGTSNYKLYIGANGPVYLSNCDYLLQDFTNLTFVDFTNARTKFVKVLRGLFKNCSSLTNINLSNFDTSNVTNMYELFRGCSSLESIDISDLDTSKNVYFSYMFDGCSSLKSLDLSNFNTSKGNTFSYMFSKCSGLTELDVSNFTTTSLTALQATFYGCTGLKTIDLSSWDTSKVTKTKSMFSGCTNLTTLDLHTFDTSQVTDMYQMFSKCNSLTSLNLSGFNTSSVTTMESMFYNCTSLTTLDISSFNTSSVTSMDSMFMGDSLLVTVTISAYWSTSSVTTSTNMFKDCTSIVGGAGTTYDSSYIDATYARSDSPLNSTPGYFTTV